MKTCFQLNLPKAALVLLIIVAVTLTISSCGGGSGSSTNETSETTAKQADLGSNIKNVQLIANQPTEIKFTYTIPGSISNQGDFTINLANTLQNISLSSSPVAQNSNSLETLWLLASLVIKDAFASSTALVSAYISYPGDPNVCSSSTRFGPYSISGTIGSALTSDTSAITPTEVSKDISNAGSFEICIVTIPPIAAYLTVTGVDIDFKQCDEATVVIANTSWSGSYQCQNFGTTSDGGQIDLSIIRNQDGSYQYTDGSGAVYDGHLCGNRFKFNGGVVDSYTESGTLVFSSNTVAIKSSIWNSIPAGVSGGKCSDTLNRVN